MKLLELFSGTGCLSRGFAARGHEVFTVDFDPKQNASLHADIEKLIPQELEARFGVPDVIWAAPDCTTYSVAAINKHRRKNTQTGNLVPMSVYARKCDRTNRHLLDIIRYFLKKNPDMLFFIENPRAGLGCMEWMKDWEKYKHTITYCKYMKNLPPQKRRMKPTDIWTNHPDPKFAPPLQLWRQLPSVGTARITPRNSGPENT